MTCLPTFCSISVFRGIPSFNVGCYVLGFFYVLSVYTCFIWTETPHTNLGSLCVWLVFTMSILAVLLMHDGFILVTYLIRKIRRYMKNSRSHLTLMFLFKTTK